MYNDISYKMETDKPFDTVVKRLEEETAQNQFRVLHVHDVQATLAEKGLERDPLKIIEVCNSAFAHEALEKATEVSLFMPCRFVVHTEGDKTVVTLARPTMISQMLPESGLQTLAEDVEKTLIKVMVDAL